MDIRKSSGFFVAGLIGVIIGYFVGREHIKYEMRSAFQSAADQFKQNAPSVFGMPAAPARQVQPPPPKPNESAPIRATLLKKWFHASNPSAHDYQDAVEFAVSFSNLTGKDIRAFDGLIEFTDLLDNRILGAKVAINEAIAANSNLKWEGQLDYNQFMAPHRRLREEDQANLIIVFPPGKILFSDGSTKKYAE
jgi:hypothetical protein